MSCHRFTGVAAALLLPTVALAADLAAVIVTATRQATRINEIVSDVTVIDREAIERAGPTTLPALLALQPGLHEVDNGGIGKTASVFLRGTSPGHTLLLIDGMPFGSATSGQPSLHNLPLSQIERIEILRGPASSLYGSDAIGGVIQVFTRRGDGPPRLDAYAGIGSNESTDFRVGFSGSEGPWSYSVAQARFRSDGFTVAADPIRYRTANGTLPNADADGYRNSSLSARVTWQPTEGHEVQANLLDASSRNAFDGGGAAVDAFNTDRSKVHGLRWRARINQAWTSTLRLGTSEDNSISFAPARSQFVTEQRQASWQNDLRLPVGELMLALEASRQSVVSISNNAINYTPGDRYVRSALAGLQGNSGAHGWQVSLRHDANSQFGNRVTHSLAYGYRFAPDWQLRFAEGTAFKAPSFNQLYFPRFGSPTLLPEKARNAEVGLAWDNGRQRAVLTHFDNRIENLIVGSPATNIGKARIRGSSLAASTSSGAWSADGGLDVMQPIDASNGNRLQRRPAQALKFAVHYTPAGWRIGAEFTAIGRRYDTTTQGRIMGGYSVTHLSAARELARDWTLEARLNNLFDRVYENAWSYAVPGRELFVGLRYAPR